MRRPVPARGKTYLNKCVLEIDDVAVVAGGLGFSMLFWSTKNEEYWSKAVLQLDWIGAGGCKLPNRSIVFRAPWDDESVKSGGQFDILIWHYFQVIFKYKI